MSGSNSDVTFVIACIFTSVNNHNLEHNGAYGSLEFVTAYIPMLAMYGYMACGGSSRLYIGMSDRPRWNSLPGSELG